MKLNPPIGTPPAVQYFEPRQLDVHWKSPASIFVTANVDLKIDAVEGKNRRSRRLIEEIGANWIGGYETGEMPKLLPDYSQ